MLTSRNVAAEIAGSNSLSCSMVTTNYLSIDAPGNQVGVWGATEQKVHLSPAISSQRHNPGPS
ncbi:hypothetical protein LU650_28180, partial [Pseudomonas monteilii]|nr:hypothetical protein [Pseudomonas monteilii]